MGKIINIPAGGASSPLTTKGDLWGFGTVDARLPVGTDGYVLVADSVESLGVKWVAQSGGGDVTAALDFAADNRLIRSDGILKGVQSSGLVLDDSDNLTELLSLKFKTGESVTWNDEFKTINIPSGTGSTLQAGQEFYFLIHNNTGVQINNGEVLKPTGAFLVGTDYIPTVILARADNHETCNGTLFVATADIANGALGMATRIGRVSGIDLSSFGGGDNLYLSPTIAGAMTNVRPEFDDYIITVGGVLEPTVSGTAAINFTTRVPDTLLSAWDGTFRESIDFLVSSSGTVITGSLDKSGGGDLTMIFGDGLSILDCTPAATIVLTEGTDTVPVVNYVFIPQSTKVLTVNTTGFPDTEHIKVADLFLQSAAKTQTDDALVNRNWNDHVKATGDNGHVPHIAERLRQNHAEWDSGAFGACTIASPTTSDVYVSATSGKVYQLHKQTFPALDSALGDGVHIANHFTTPYVDITNLNTQTLDALGVSLANSSFSFVLWGVQNKTGETSHLMLNLPTGSYGRLSPDNAVDDASNHSVYDIPRAFRGKGFLISRFTYQLASNGTDWTLYDTEDLRGKIPNTTAGGGAGGSGVTDFTGLLDTPISYIGQGLKPIRVAVGETALEFYDPQIIESFIMAAGDATTDLIVEVVDDTFRMPYAFTLTGIRASLVTAATGATLDVDVLENASSILSTRITIDATEKTSTTATIPAVISDSSLADDSEMSIEIKTVGSTIAGSGLKVTLIGYRT